MRPHQAPGYSRRREAPASLHVSAPPPTHTPTRLLEDSLPLHLPRDAAPKDPAIQGEGAPAGRRAHAAPRAGRHHVAPAAEECREGAAHSPPRTRTLPTAPPAGTRLPPPASRRAPNAQAERPRAAPRMAPNCQPAARRGHSLPRRPSLASPFSPPLSRAPCTRATRSLTAEGPRDRGGKPRLQ